MAAGLAGPPAIIAALAREAAGFSRKQLTRHEVLLEVTGPGQGPASAGAERAVERGASVLVSWGSAGALAEIGPGGIVLATGVIDDTGVRRTTDEELAERLAGALTAVAPVHRGDIVTAPAPVAAVDDKRALARSTGAIAVDMESAAIARVAKRAGVPLVVLRVIVDASDRPVPPAAIAAMDGPRVRPGRVLVGLLASPGQLRGLVGLAVADRCARRTLAGCARRLPGALVRTLETANERK